MSMVDLHLHKKLFSEVDTETSIPTVMEAYFEKHASHRLGSVRVIISFSTSTRGLALSISDFNRSRFLPYDTSSSAFAGGHK